MTQAGLALIVAVIAVGSLLARAILRDRSIPRPRRATPSAASYATVLIAPGALLCVVMPFSGLGSLPFVAFLISIAAFSTPAAFLVLVLRRWIDRKPDTDQD